MSPHAAPLPLALFALLSACQGGLGKDYECKRPAGSPVERGFVGDAGQDGCVADDACVSEPGDEGGTCVRGAQCVLDGLSSGVGVSKDCDIDEVCEVASGAWYGFCEPLEPAMDDIGGTLTCDELTQPLDVAAGEVVEFFALFSPPDDPDAGASASMRIEDSAGPIIADGVALGERGTANGRALGLELRHSFQQAASLSWIFSVEECNPTRFAASYTRVAGPVVNGSAAAAMPLSFDESVTGLLGCFDENGVGGTLNLPHYYALQAEAGDTLDIALTSETWSGSGLTGWILLSLQDASGPVMDGAEPVVIDTFESSDVNLSYSVKKAGVYYLKLEQDPTYCDVARYTLQY